MTPQDLFDKMIISTRSKINFYLGLGFDYAQAKQETQKSTTAGLAVWQQIDNENK